MGRTRKPCPGCGDVCEYRPALEVCGGCKGLLTDGAKYRQLSESSGDKPYGIPRCAHALPHIKHASHPFKSDVDFRKDFQRAMHDLLKAIGGPAPQNGPWNSRELFQKCGREHSASGTVMLQEHVACLLGDMYKAVQNMTEHAFSEGKDHGSNLLMRLASGDVSVNVFNEATIRGE